MKNTPLNKIKINMPALAFLMVFGGLLVLRLINSQAFDGTYSMLYSDCYHQYYPFFLEFRRALLSGDSLLYSWNVGMGMDYFGLIAYYLASPLNLLSILVPENWMLGYFSLLMPIKLGLASAFFALFLKKVFNKDDFSVAVFGCFYGLCAWALGYQWNIMWLDTFALLPLVILGLVSLLKERKFLLYTISLFLSVFSNYYIGLFACIFVMLVFICYEICRWEGFKKFFTDLLFVALFSIIAIAMTAVLELPAFAALQTTQSSVNKFPEEFRLNMTDDHTWKGLFEAMRLVAGNMNGGLEPSFKEGLPNLYCGVITNILAFLFLTCKQVRLRDKICSVFLLLFFNVSFIIRQLDYIWHGFHFTNMIPYRFSFLYSFVMLYMAYHAWTLRHNFKFWQIIIASVLSIGLFFCSDDPTMFVDLLSGKVALLTWDTPENVTKNIETITTHSTYVLYNVIFLGLYLAVLSYVSGEQPKEELATEKVKLKVSENKSFKVGTTLLLCVMIVELTLNLANFGSWFPGTNVVNYPKGTVDSQRAISYMHEREDDGQFYRAEVTHSQTLNDGALNNYNGISTFTSSANVRVTEFMRTFGYGAKNTYNRYCYEESSPVANLFLNLKYMIERDGRVEANSYFDDLHYFGNVHLLENNAYLPLGFLTNSQILNIDFTQYTSRMAFQFQNDFFKAATGLSEDVWHSVPSSNIIINGRNININATQIRSGYCSYSASTSGTVVYSFTADRDGFMCVNLEQGKRNSPSIYLNGQFLYSDTYSLPQMMAVSEVKAGDVVEVRLSCTAGESSWMFVNAAILKDEVFREGYDILNTATMELTTFKNTHIEGTIACDRDGVLYTSIPQDGNWVVTVDGKPVEPVMIGDAMVGVLLTEGNHTLTFTFQNKAFTIGLIVSIASLLLFLGLYWIYYRPAIGQKIGKYLKKEK